MSNAILHRTESLGNPQPQHADIAAVLHALDAAGGIAADDLSVIPLPRERAEAVLHGLQRAGLAELDPGDPGPTWWPTTPEALILRELDTIHAIATAPLAERIGMSEEPTATVCRELVKAGKVERRDNGYGRDLWSIAPPPARETGERVAGILAGLTPEQAQTIRLIVEDTLSHWRDTASAQATQPQGDDAPLGKLTGQRLATVGETGLCPECEGPDIALAPAETFAPGERWRLHRSIDPEHYGASDPPWLSWVFIRDGMTRGETLRAIAEAWGARLVEDYGEHFPELPVAPVYRSEDDDHSTPWPTIRVPRELWPGCWRSCDPSRPVDAHMGSAFDEWDRAREGGAA